MKLGNCTFNWAEDLVNRLGGVEMAEAYKHGMHPVQQAAAQELHFHQWMEPLSFEERLLALKRPSYVDKKIVDKLRPTEHGEVELIFVRCLDRRELNLADAPAWMRGRGLEFVDPFVLMAWNAAHPMFSHRCRNLTQWQAGDDIFPAAAKFETRQFEEPFFELRAQQHRSWGPDWWLAGTPIL